MQPPKVLILATGLTACSQLTPAPDDDSAVPRQAIGSCDRWSVDARETTISSNGMISHRSLPEVPQGRIQDASRFRARLGDVLGATLEGCGEILVPLRFRMVLDERGKMWIFDAQEQAVGPIGECARDWLMAAHYPSQTEAVEVTVHATCAEGR